MARILLVHGAFHGKWCWEPVIGELEARGHAVEAIDLPGHGEDATPPEQVTMDLYGERVARALRAGEPAVLVGHSMGGLAVTQGAAKARDAVDRIVYVTAFLPRDGQSLGELASSVEADDAVQRNMVVEPPVATMPPAGGIEAFFNLCTPEQAAWASERLGPQPLAPLDEPVTLGGGIDEIDCYYVHCSEDRCISPALQRRMVADSPCEDTVELVADHSPFLSATDELADALDRFARA